MLLLAVGHPRRHPAGAKPGLEPSSNEAEQSMLDVVYLIGGCAFFALAVLYTTACDHL